MKRFSTRVAAAVLAMTCAFGAVVPSAFAYNGNGACKSSTYCAYHHKNHKTKSSCSKYCAYHKTTHASGKKHSANGNGVCDGTGKGNNGVCKGNCKK